MDETCNVIDKTIHYDVYIDKCLMTDVKINVYTDNDMINEGEQI